MPNQNTGKTHCNYGHELSGDNLYVHNGKRSCKICRANWKINHPEYAAQWYARNAEYVRLYKVCHKYNIEPEEFFSWFDIQKGRCAICRKKLTLDKFTHVDHVHSTGEIRGLLCSNCNLGIGMFKENVKFLQSAISYLM